MAPTASPVSPSLPPSRCYCLLCAGKSISLTLQWKGYRCGFKLSFFPTIKLFPVESNCETTALYASSEIPPNFNNSSCVLKTVLLPLSFSNYFLSPPASSKLPPLFSIPQPQPLCFSLSTHSCCFVWYFCFQLTSVNESSPLHLLPQWTDFL